MRELIDFIKGCLDSQRSESYTRTAGFTTLYFYLLWATYKVSCGVPMAEIDMPKILAAFLFCLYGFGETVKAVIFWIQGKGGNNAATDNPVPPQV